MKKKDYIKPYLQIAALEVQGMFMAVSWTPDGGETVYPVVPGEGGGSEEKDPYGGYEESKGNAGGWSGLWD